MNFQLPNKAHQSGFLNLPNDNMVKTLGVAIVLCLVCSVIVSGAATLLKPKQVANKALDKKQNILAVAGVDTAGLTTEEAFKKIEARIVDLETGEYSDAVDPVTYDQRKAAKDPEFNLDLSKADNIAQIAGLPKYANVYLVTQDDAIQRIILPIEGYGLWGTMYGFIALDGDAETVANITFYEHKETPGLGGEIENKGWQASWDGKALYNEQGATVLQLIKGSVGPDTADSEHKIDGLAGATLTSRGVTNMIQFWMSDKAFGPYLEKVRSGKVTANKAELNSTKEHG